MLMLGNDMSWLFCWFDVLIEPRRWSLFLFAKYINHASLEHGIDIIAARQFSTNFWIWKAGRI